MLFNSPLILSSCYSYIGRRGGKQVVSLARRGCLYHGTVQHELLHALGFNHEQTRSDRDNHIKVLLHNVQSGNGAISNSEDFIREGTQCNAVISSISVCLILCFMTKYHKLMAFPSSSTLLIISYFSNVAVRLLVNGCTASQSSLILLVSVSRLYLSQISPAVEVHCVNVAL